MSTFLSVSTIEDGTVIDHIPAGRAARIITLLGLDKRGQQMTVGLNLQSDRHQHKDLLKIINYRLTDEECEQVTVIAPNATVNYVEQGKVVNKYHIKPPADIRSILLCPNPNCISREPVVSSRFHIKPYKNHVKLLCHYCENLFEQEDMQDMTSC